MTEAGGHQIQVYNVPQDNVDETVYYLCSEPLTQEQITQLWEGGDLCIGDKEYWVADDFPQLLDMVTRYLIECETESEELQPSSDDIRELDDKAAEYIKELVDATTEKPGDKDVKIG